MSSVPVSLTHRPSVNSNVETTNCILAAFPMKVTTALPRTFFVQVEIAPMDPEKNLENSFKVMCVHAV